MTTTGREQIPSRIRIDVVVLQCGLSDLTVRLLSSMDDVEALHVILVDNGSPEQDVVAAECALDAYAPNYTLIRNAENRGFAPAVNQGIQVGRAPFVCIQNNDTIMFPGAHMALTRHLERSPEFGVVGPLTNAATTLQRCNGPDARTADPVLVETTGLVAFFCAMLPRRVIDRVGLLSEEFGLGYGEDDDYCIRLRRAGYRLGIAHDAYVHHDHHATYLHTIGQEGIDREGAQGHAKLRELYGDMETW